MPQQERANPDDIAKFMESPDYQNLPPQEKTKVFNYLKTRISPGTPPMPDTAGETLRRRQLVTGNVEKSILGHAGSGIMTGLENVASVPGAVKRAATEPPTEYEKGRHLRHPLAFTEPQRGIGLTLDRLFLDPQLEQGVKARQAFQSGDTREGLARIGFALVPGLGPMAAHFAETADQKGWVEAMGEQAVYALAGLATKKLTHGVDPSKRLSAAAGGGAKEFESVMGDLAETARQSGKPKTVAQLYDLVKSTGRRLETQFNLALHPIASTQVMPSEVASNLLKEANKFDIHTPEGRAARLYLRQRAVDYQKPWTLGELNQKRMKMLDATLEDKTQVKQMGAVRASVERLADKTVEDSLRDIVYGEMDKRYKGASFRDLKEKQAKLLDLNHRLQNRVSDIADKQAAYETAGPLKKAGFYVRGHASGLTPAVHPKFEGSPEKAASRQIRKGFSRLRNPIKAKPFKRSLPPLEPEAPSGPQTPPKSNPSPTTGQSESDVEEIRRRGPGVNPEDVKARDRQAEFLKTKRENLAGQRKEVPQKAADIRKEQERGRPLPRKPETEIAKAANENSPEQARYYQEQAAKNLFGKTYDELTVQERVKTLSEGAKLQDATRKAKQSYAEFKGKGVTVKGKPGTVIGTSFGSLTVKLSNGDIVRVTPDEVKPGLSPLE